MGPPKALDGRALISLPSRMLRLEDVGEMDLSGNAFIFCRVGAFSSVLCGCFLLCLAWSLLLWEEETYSVDRLDKGPKRDSGITEILLSCSEL